MSTWIFFSKKVFSFRKIFFEMKNFPEFCIEILNENRKFSIFRFFEIFDFSKKIVFRFFIKDFNAKLWKFFHLKKYFHDYFFWFFFQLDITSSDLNEFWIGQKIVKAESLLLNLSTTLWGLGGLELTYPQNTYPPNRGTIKENHCYVLADREIRRPTYGKTYCSRVGCSNSYHAHTGGAAVARLMLFSARPA